MKYSYIWILICLSCCKPVDRKSVDLKIEKLDEYTNVIFIDSLYSKIFNQYKLNFKEISCSFYYLKSNESNGEYFAKLNENCIKDEIGYCSFFDEREDLLILNSDTIKLTFKLDPLTMRMYSLILKSGTNYSIFTAKGQSASGRGSQITYFVILELNKIGNVHDFFEIESRFGNINNILDYKEDGRLDFLKVSNDEELGEFKLTVHNVKTQQREVSDSILLKYVKDDQFLILNSTIPLVLN